jgi:hypothetical protein
LSSQHANLTTTEALPIPARKNPNSLLLAPVIFINHENGAIEAWLSWAFIELAWILLITNGANLTNIN